MMNLFFGRQNLLCGSKRCAAILMVLCLLGWNHDAFGQDCSNSTLKGGTIVIKTGSETMCEGSILELKDGVAASAGAGGPYTYQLEKRTNGNNGTWLDMWDTPLTYAIDHVDDTLQIRRRVIDRIGCIAYSDTITIIVYGKLDGGTIGSDRSICYNTPSGTLYPTAASGGDGGFSYQWQWLDGNTWTAVPSGGTSEDYDPGNLTATTKYRRMATNNCGDISSDTITVTVYGELDGGMIATDNSNICSGFSPGILKSLAEASGGNGEFSYQWQWLDGSTWTDVPDDGTSENYDPGKLIATTKYRRMATATCGEISSDTITITVTTLPVLGTLSYNSPICIGTTGTPLWTTTPAAGTYSISSATGLSIDPNTGVVTAAVGTATGTDTVTYTVAAAGGCPAVTKDTAITVAAVPTVGAITTPAAICAGSKLSMTAPNVTNNNGSAPPSGSWQLSDAAGTLFVDVDLDTCIFRSADNNKQIRYRATNGCGDGYSNTVTVTVTQPVTLGDLSYNNGNPICITLGTVNPSWSSTTPTGGTYSASPSGLSIDSNTGDITPAGSTKGDYAVTYTVPAAGGCPVVTETVTIIVATVPAVATIIVTDAICEGSPLSIAAPTVNYNGSAAVSPAESWQLGDAAGTLFVDVDLDTCIFTSADNNKQIRYRATNGCGDGYSNEVPVTVTTLPVLGSLSYNRSICIGTPANPLWDTPPTPGTYSIFSAQGLSIDQSTGAVTAVVGTVTGDYTVTYTVAAAGGCPAVTETAAIIVATVPAVATITAADAICEGSSLSMTLPDVTSNNGSAPQSASWQLSDAAGTSFVDVDLDTCTFTSADNNKTLRYRATNGCGAGYSNAVTVTVNPLPSAPTTEDTTVFYDGTPHTAVATAGNDEEIIWYYGEIGGTSYPTAPSRTEPGTLTVYAAAKNTVTGCESPTRTAVSVTVKPLSGAPVISGQPSDTAYCVCETEVTHRLAVTPETNNIAGINFRYQWYEATSSNIAGGKVIDGATDSIYHSPAGLAAGTYYYYCTVTSDYYSEPAYSRIATVEVEHDNTDIKSLTVNNKDMDGQTEYMAQCDEDRITVGAVAASKYARVSVIVNGRKYDENLEAVENLEIQLIDDLTEITVRIATCDAKTFSEYTLTVTKALEKLIYQRWDNSLAVYRNPEKNGGYSDIRGVRWYKHDRLIATQTVPDLTAEADLNVPEEWFVRLADGEPTDIYRAEVNIAGRWHRVCGTPVKNAAVSKAYPNPAPSGANITIELPFVPLNGRMNIVSINGSVVKRDIPLTSNINTVNIGNLFPGLYLMQIIDATETIILKLIVGN